MEDQLTAATLAKAFDAIRALGAPVLAPEIVTFRAIPAGRPMKVRDGGRDYWFIHPSDLDRVARPAAPVLTPTDRALRGDMNPMFGGVLVFDLDARRETDAGALRWAVFARAVQRVMGPQEGLDV